MESRSDAHECWDCLHSSVTPPPSRTHEACLIRSIDWLSAQSFLSSRTKNSDDRAEIRSGTRAACDVAQDQTNTGDHTSGCEIVNKTSVLLPQLFPWHGVSY
jgi:hypothetical protein